MTGAPQVLTLETALGVSTGHDEAVAFVDELIDRVESTSKPAMDIDR